MEVYVGTLKETSRSPNRKTPLFGWTRMRDFFPWTNLMEKISGHRMKQINIYGEGEQAENVGGL